LAGYLYENYPDKAAYEDIITSPFEKDGEPFWTIMAKALTNLAKDHPALLNEDRNIVVSSEQLDAYAAAVFQGISFLKYETQITEGTQWENGIREGYTFVPEQFVYLYFKPGAVWDAEDGIHVQFLAEYIEPDSEAVTFEMVLAEQWDTSICRYEIASLKRVANADESKTTTIPAAAEPSAF
jgi:hypothetical protein